MSFAKKENMKKRVVFTVLLAVLLLMTFVNAQYYDSKGFYHDENGQMYEPGKVGTVGQALLRETDTSTYGKESVVSEVTGFILDVFALKWLKVNQNESDDAAVKLAAVTRFMIWLAVLILVNYGMSMGLKQFPARSRKTLAVVVATIAAIFIPPNLLIGIGGLYGGLIALVFLGVPLILAIVLVFGWEDKDK